MKICEFIVVILQQDVKPINFCLEKCEDIVKYNLINMGIDEKNIILFDLKGTPNILQINEFVNTRNLSVLFLSERAFCFGESEFIRVVNEVDKHLKVRLYDKNDKNCEQFYGFCVKREEFDANTILNYVVNENSSTEIVNVTTDNTLAKNNTDLRVKSELCNRKIIEKHEENGVVFLSLDGVLISPLVKIGKGTIIYPGTILRGTTEIGENCEIGANSRIENSVVGSDTILNSTQVYNSYIGNNVKIGPFCHIRPNSKICDGVKIGDFVEVKNSTVGENTHASHLTYIGDSDVGKNVNFGCGTVTVNYDGKNKARCTIEDDAFIGCNTNLIAPVKIGKLAFTAAGSTITKDVPEDSLAISRTRETRVIENWSERRK